MNLQSLFHHQRWRSCKMSVKKNNIAKIIVLVIILGAIAYIIYPVIFSPKNTELPKHASDMSAIKPSAPVEISEHVSPPSLDTTSIETIQMDNSTMKNTGSVTTVMSPLMSGAPALNEKGVDEVFLTFSAKKANAETNKDSKKVGDTTPTAAVPPPKFTSERKILPITGASIGSGEQMVMFGPGSTPGMTQPPAPEPEKTKVVFCADGDCGELTSIGYKKIVAPLKVQRK